MRSLQINPSITSANSLVEIYFNEISKVKLCTADDEIELARKIRQGDKTALEQLTKSNLRFVVSVAKKYQYQGLALADLISEGNLGLIKAAHRFDETRGFKFISFAVWWIRQSIIAAITENARMVRLPVNKIHEITKINKAICSVEQQMLREPSAEQVAEYLNVEVSVVKDALQDAKWTTSIDNTYGEEEFSLLDKVPCTDFQADGLITAEAADTELTGLLLRLPERERILIELSYGLNGQFPMSPGDISVRLGLGIERVRQLKKVALNNLRKLTSLN
jgi:RNA polymerase primary sigma factor